ncbi:purine nucleoside phosphorylase-like, partial [Branchiostoma lanceolatum]|uniref:purine nucleoside phosphorylase-like n=1 Tax=Branchiostoma lanceolatum TaxID=7740 RepID=UPI00345286D4
FDELIPLLRPTYEDIQHISDFLLKTTNHRPKIAVICGSGLGGLADVVQEQDVIDYSDIPNFPKSTVQGHRGRLVFGHLAGKTVVCMQGRFHQYEGYPLWKVAMPVRVFKMIGVETLFVTNAAGGLNSGYTIDDIMIIKDHISMPGLTTDNPLKGSTNERFGNPIPPVSELYDRELRELAMSVAGGLGLGQAVREGVLVQVGGPSFDTVSVFKLLRRLGADCVGMSSAPEVTVARHCGIRVFGLSLVTDMAPMESDLPPTNHLEILETAQTRALDVQKLICEMIKQLPNNNDSIRP